MESRNKPPNLSRREFLDFLVGLGFYAAGGYGAFRLVKKILATDDKTGSIPQDQPVLSQSVVATESATQPATDVKKELENGYSYFLSVEPLSQQDKRWADITLGKNPKKAGMTIGGYGCLTTSLSSYLIATGEKTMTPDQVNQKLKENRGFQGKSGNFDFNSGPLALGLKQTGQSKIYYDEPVDQKGLKFVQQNLSAGKPLLAWVDMNLSTIANEEHYVLVIGYGKDKNGRFIYSYMDSWDGMIYTVSEKIFARKAIQFFAYDKKIQQAIVETKKLVMAVPGQTQIREEAEINKEAVNDQGYDFDPKATLAGNYPEKVARWAPQIVYFAHKRGIPPELVATMVWFESGGNPEAYSRSGAVGLMQVMPRDGIAADFTCANGPCFANRPSIKELKDPNFNIKIGCAMLSRLNEKNHRDIRKALKEYGPMNVGNYYADTVLAVWKEYSPETHKTYINKK